MASYLTTVNIGEFELHAYKADGIRYWDAIDPDLFDPPAEPRTGEQFAISQQSEPSYKRLDPHDLGAGRRRGACPSGSRGTPSPNWDFVFVEAHTPGRTTGRRCEDLQRAHQARHRLLVSVLARSAPVPRALPDRQRRRRPAPRAAPRVTGGPRAAPATATSSGRSTSPPTPEATSRCRSATRATTPCSWPARSWTTSIVSTGEGTTSFEDDGDTFDGWTVPGPRPAASPTPTTGSPGTVDDTPPTLGEIAEGSFARQPEIIDFLSGICGRTVVGVRRDRRRHRPARVRARDPDPADLLEALLRRLRWTATASSSTSWPTSGSATTSPSQTGSTSG